MSEWKWCRNCEHRYEAHRPLKAEAFGPCAMPDCDCQKMDWDLSDL